MLQLSSNVFQCIFDKCGTLSFLQNNKNKVFFRNTAVALPCIKRKREERYKLRLHALTWNRLQGERADAAAKTETNKTKGKESLHDLFCSKIKHLCTCICFSLPWSVNWSPWSNILLWQIYTQCWIRWS
jgi:hypothetical protein